VEEMKDREKKGRKKTKEEEPPFLCPRHVQNLERTAARGGG